MVLGKVTLSIIRFTVGTEADFLVAWDQYIGHCCLVHI